MAVSDYKGTGSPDADLAFGAHTSLQSLPYSQSPLANQFDEALLVAFEPVRAPSPNRYARWVKPVADRLVALVLLVVLLPLIAAIALAIRVNLGPGVLFRQRRIGYGALPFTVFKFRTMRRGTGDEPAHSCAEHGHKCPSNPRLTRFGRVLRQLSLDELPQLVNVVRGDMSIVGPRPELPEIVARYEGWQHRRHEVKPGLTGLWQVTARGNGILMWQLTELDIDYVERLSFRTDVSIVIRTVPALLIRHRGT